MGEGKRKIYHCTAAQQFSRDLLEDIFSLTDKIRKISQSKAGAEKLASCLNHKRAMLYFVQPSTRTFLSFYCACQILGIKCTEVRDPRTSSEIKGESEEDTVRTFSSYLDLIIMRHPKAKFADKIAMALNDTDRPVPIINAGSGKDQHPTQALLDIYTLKQSFKSEGGTDNLKIAFVGDLLRGRTVHSLSYLLTKFDNVKQYFVAPEEFQISAEVREDLDKSGVDYELGEDFESIIPEVDAIYMTRLQDEWDKEDGTSGKIDNEKYSFKKEHLQILKKNAVLMHPLPRRAEIAPEVDKDERAIYWKQARNGMWVRTALIAMIFGCEEIIADYATEKPDGEI